MIESLLPPPLAVADTRHDRPDSVLYPAEAQRVAGAVDARRREFATVRFCARQALGELGVSPAPILNGERGAPIWPDGTVGSMTHCQGYRAAAVAYATDLATIGIDAEPDLPIRAEGTRELVMVPEERARVAALRVRRPEVAWDRLVFSAKESVYKAWFPLTGRWLDFHEAVITIDPDRGTFHARLLVPGPEIGGSRVRAFEGSWLRREGILLTAIALTHAAVDVTRPVPSGGRSATAVSGAR
ncbi:4'-phosphopantetheinyl transferase superfamily protein [Streptomyces sp. NPDC046332]|uniref:4'-phosphopantetheinyl transferase family protein n=1 Tax=Streptomyces sp. NPDC046332 TaxID=3155133 RepID=UPI00340368C1